MKTKIIFLGVDLGLVLMVGIFTIVFIGIIGVFNGNAFELTGNEGTGSGYDCSGVASISSENYTYVRDAAAIHLSGDEPALIAVIQIESGWRADATNGNAAGLGQFMPGTAKGFKEFVGGDDKHGTTWPAGIVYDDSSHSDDARFESQRSIYATAHYLSGAISEMGNLGDAYEFRYHGGSTDAQKAEAHQARLRLEEIYNKLKTGGGCKQTAGSTSGVGCNNVPQFKQCDKQWGQNSYNCGNTTICSSGCGVSSAAMVLKFYGKDVDPALMAQKSLEYGTRECGSGTAHSFFPKIAQEYGLKNENGISWARAMQLLNQGKPVIVSGSGSKPFTRDGHYVVMTCYNTDGTISVNDPYFEDTNYSEYTLQSQEHFLTAIYQ